VHLAVRRQVGRLLVETDDATLRLRRLEQLFVFFGFRHPTFLASRTGTSSSFLPLLAATASRRHGTCIGVSQLKRTKFKKKMRN